ncbi:TonB-dependent receptor [Accumulibacter sp.]|uniref:TonB-dependent receptor plug domain-containing protein n=1 Tax=Accumulibacter sp. TaxID=2053492 RepID=UPI002BF3992D|nr:TonB-dependent receptor [Accumulibacter sp.]HNE39590.1 TonB-dependent receptor [Accumulibacter sp.]
MLDFHRPRRVALAVALACSGTASAEAAERGESDAPMLGDIVVSDSKIQPVPAALLLTPARLRQMRAATSDTASLLRDIPGVELQAGGGVSSLPVIHGLADDRHRIKLDGMDLISTCPNHMNPPLSYIDPSQVGSLTVHSALPPVSAGGDSIGSTIIVKSRPPRFAAARDVLLNTGEFGAYYRSNGGAFGGNLAATLASDQLSVGYQAAYAESDNYRAGQAFKTTRETGRAGHRLALDEVGSSAYRTASHVLGLALRNENHLIDLKFGWQNVPEQLYPNQRMDMTDNRQQRVNLQYQGQFAWGSLEARAYRESVRHKMDFGTDKRFWYGTATGGPTAAFATPCSPIGVNCAAGMPMESESSNLGASVHAAIDLSPQDLLRVGVDQQRYRLDDGWPPSGAGMWPGTFWNINNGQRDRLGAFAEWEGRLNARWTTLLGVRYERVRMDAGVVQGYSTASGATGNQYADANAFNARKHVRTDHNWEMTALARHVPNRAVDLDFGFAHKVRSPNLYERYTWSTWSMAAVMNNFAGDGNGYLGNLDLKPEKAWTLSATLDWHADDRSWALTATPYYTRVSDYIDALRCTSGASCTPANATSSNSFVVLQYANQAARLVGVDLSGHAPLAATALGSFAVKGKLGYTNGRNRDTGDSLYNIMPLNARVSLTHTLGGWDNAVELVTVKRKDKVADARNEIRTPGYSLVNLRASHTWKDVRVDFGIDNVFDKFHVQPLGGAYLGQGTTMSINAVPWGIGLPGMGRSFYAGISVKL